MPQLPDAFFKVMNATNRVAKTLSGGRIGGSLMGMPTLELTTTGRKSGQPRTVILTPPVVEGDRLILVASKGGNDEHPDWYRNLVANPQVEIGRDGKKRRYTARTASPEERAELWPRITESYSGYGDYQKRAKREIPVVICDPAP